MKTDPGSYSWTEDMKVSTILLLNITGEFIFGGESFGLIGGFGLSESYEKPPLQEQAFY